MNCFSVHVRSLIDLLSHENNILCFHNMAIRNKLIKHLFAVCLTSTLLNLSHVMFTKVDFH